MPVSVARPPEHTVDDLARIRHIAHLLPHLVWTCTPDGRCTFLNAGWSLYTGVEEHRHHGFGWLDALHPDDVDRARQAWARFLADGTPYAIEYRLRGADGAYRWFETRARLVRDEAGGVLGVLGTSTDVDDRTRAESALRESRERLDAALAASQTGTFRWDMASNALQWDAQLDRLFGLAPGSSVQSLDGFVALVHPDDRAEVVARCVRCAADGADFAMVFRVVWPDGRVRWLDDRGKAFRDAAGRPGYMTGACVDVTDRMDAEQAQRRSEARHREVLESITDAFFAVDAAWRFTYVNSQAEALLGRAPGALLGQELWREFPGLVGSPFEELYRRVAMTRQAASLTAYYPDHRRYYEVRAFPGASAGLAVYFRDATGEVTAEREMVRLAEDRRRALDAAGLGAWHIDGATGALQVDARVRSIFGIDAPMVELEEVLQRIHPDDRARVRAGLDAARDVVAPVAHDDEHRILHADGRVTWVHAAGQALFEGEGPARRVVSIDGTIGDITERKRTEQALRDGERRLRAAYDLLEGVADGTDEMIVAVDRDLRFTLVNRAYARAFQAAFGTEPILGASVREALAHVPVDQSNAIPLFERALAGEYVHETMAFGEESRARRVYELRFFPLRDAAGTIVGVGEIARDVTVRALADAERERLLLENAATAAANAKFRAFFEQGTQLAAVLTLEGRVIEANRLYLDVCGVTREEVQGRLFWACGWWGGCSSVAAHVHDAVRQAAAGVVIRRETSYFVAGAAERTMDLTLAPVTDDDGTVLFVAATGVDITDRLRAQASLKDEDRRKDEFLAMLAHELRNPLAPLRNGLEVLRLAEGTPGAGARAREMMARQLGHMVRLVDDLLDISRISRNRLELRRGVVALRDVVSTAVETALPAIEAAAHELHVTLPPQPVHLDADVTRLAQVFSNLLTNAAKYTDAGGTIALEARVDGAAVLVEVRDTGIGIPRDALASVFDMFSQVDRSIERSAGGLGIGLALVKGLVEMHGGTATAESPGPGAGSTFRVRLPLAAVDDPAAREQDGSNGPRPAGSRLRVLVADDNEDAAESLAVLLEVLGHEPSVVHDGEAAVRAAATLRPDVIFMDVGMPRLNGLEATRRIRAQAGPQPRIVALTGWGQEQDRRESTDAGCDGHLVKPVHVDQLATFLDPVR